jgi:iron(III) transport system ATP-binding protein
MSASQTTREQVPVVSVRDLRKTFTRADGTPVTAVDDVTLEVDSGEFVVLLGPSGCGKTTLLRCIAGLERPASGRIEIHGEPMYDSERKIEVPPQGRHLSMIFQSYALWPHMTAFENIAYPLKSRRVPKAEVKERVHQALTLVGIPELVEQHPGDMSGGQQQRVALARALVAGDELVLFDEPLSNVDAKVRDQLRFELLQMQRDIGFSAIYVTHDQVEAMELAHRIAVMNAGRVAQVGSPREIYERPRSRYVANFIGTANELHGSVVASDGDLVVVDTALGDVRTSAGEGVTVGDDVVVVFRPERCQFSSESRPELNSWEGEVQASIFLGSHTEHVVKVAEGIDFLVWRPDPRLFEEHGTVWLVVDPRDARALPMEDIGADGERDGATGFAS